MNKEFEAYVMKVIKKFKPILLLDRFTFKVAYPCENKNSLMECKFRYPYLDASIIYNNEAVSRWKKKEDMTQYVVHEMCHLITDPLYSKATNRFVSKGEIEDERELLTDYITNIVLKSI